MLDAFGVGNRGQRCGKGAWLAEVSLEERVLVVAYQKGFICKVGSVKHLQTHPKSKQPLYSIGLVKT